MSARSDHDAAVLRLRLGELSDTARDNRLRVRESMPNLTERMAAGQRRAVAKRHELQARIVELEADLANYKRLADHYREQRDSVTRKLLEVTGCTPKE